MPTLKNIKDLEKSIDVYLKFSINKISSLVKQKIEEFIKLYYEEYSPEYYMRTWTFLNSVCKTEAIKKGRVWEAVVYIDTSIIYNSTAYYQDGTPYKKQRWSVKGTAALAEKGLHGNIHVANELHFWSDAVRDIINRKMIAQEFANFLKKNSINVKIV